MGTMGLRREEGEHATDARRTAKANEKGRQSRQRASRRAGCPPRPDVGGPRGPGPAGQEAHAAPGPRPSPCAPGGPRSPVQGQQVGLALGVPCTSGAEAAWGPPGPSWIRRGRALRGR